MKRQSKKLATDLLSDSLAAQLFLRVEYKSDMSFFRDLMHLVESIDQMSVAHRQKYNSIIYSKASSDMEVTANRYPKVPEGVHRIDEILASIDGDAQDILNEEIHSIVLENLPPEDFTFTHLYTRGLNDTENKS